MRKKLKAPIFAADPMEWDSAGRCHGNWSHWDSWCQSVYWRVLYLDFGLSQYEQQMESLFGGLISYPLEVRNVRWHRTQDCTAFAILHVENWSLETRAVLWGTFPLLQNLWHPCSSCILYAVQLMIACLSAGNLAPGISRGHLLCDLPAGEIPERSFPWETLWLEYVRKVECSGKTSNLFSEMVNRVIMQAVNSGQGNRSRWQWFSQKLVGFSFYLYKNFLNARIGSEVSSPRFHCGCFNAALCTLMHDHKLKCSSCPNIQRGIARQYLLLCSFKIQPLHSDFIKTR